MNRKFIELGFAKLDIDRLERQGFPEAIFCPGKSKEHIIKIMERMKKAGQDILATRADREIWKEVTKHFKDASYDSRARTIILRVSKRSRKLRGRVLVICAGTADIPVAEEARITCTFLGNRVESIYDVGVAGLHRLLNFHKRLRRARVVIVVAGMEGALPGVVGGLVSVPVIGVPTSVGYGANLKGVTALLGMLNSCSSNVTVVNIDNGFGAGVVASLINR